MKTLLVPVDFSSATNRVIRAATELGGAFGAKIVLLHVIVPVPPVTNDFALPVGAIQDVALISERAAEKRLGRLASKIRAARIETEVVVLHGPPGSCIVEQSKRSRANCIVMGSHGHGKLYEIFLGGTASSVIKQATCAVHIVPPKRK